MCFGIDHSNTKTLYYTRILKTERVIVLMTLPFFLTEPSLATAPAGSGPPLQVLPPPSENSPEPATDSASASDLPAAPAGSGSVSRHLSSGSGSSAAAAAAPPSHNDKKDMFKDFPGGDTAISAPSYDNWGGQSRGSGKPFASEQSSDSRCGHFQGVAFRANFWLSIQATVFVVSNCIFLPFKFECKVRLNSSLREISF